MYSPKGKQNIKMENGKRSEMLAKEKVGKLLCKLSLPSIVAMMVHALYNVVDTIFVGKGVGTLGIGGIAIVFPVQMIIVAVGQTIGMGGASRISRRMGARDPEGAALTFGNMLILAEILGVTVLALGLIAMEPLLGLFGATEEILPYAGEYFQIILLGVPLLTFAFASNDAIRAEGNAKVAMVAMMIGSGLNILLDPLFIFTLGMGIRGAAIATVISIGITSFFLLGYFISGRSEIPIGFRYLRLKANIVREILTVGSSSFVMATAMSFTMALVNNTLRALGGPVEIAAFGVIHRMFSFIFMPIMGLTQGMQPLVGFNYGARQFHRVRRGVRLTGIASVVISSTGFLAVLLFPETIMRAFTNDQALVQVGKEALRYCIFGLPLAGFQIMSGGLFQALGKPIPALILSLSRQVLILIPLMAILPRFIGLKGVWLSFPTADTFSFALALSFLFWAMRRLLSPPGISEAPIEGSRVPAGHFPSSVQEST
jgi:putative MATE family efflux protein